MDIPINWDLVNNDIKKFGFEGEIKTSKVVDVYDSHAIKIVFQFYKNYLNLIVELQGRHAEIRTRNLAEKEFGLKVRDELRKKILNKIVKVKCGDFDKYGRLLVEVITDENENIKEWLINSEYAFPYDGGKKLD